MNLPNKLTCLRIIMIPMFLFFMIFPWICGFTASRIIAAAVFSLTALTDMLDGKIARKYNLITDFGKFMDPLADKMMVFGAIIGIIVLTYEQADTEAIAAVSGNYKVFSRVFAWAAFIIIFRELAVTSMRLVVSKSDGIVIAANIFGKLKTVSQIFGIIIILLEPLLWNGFAASYAATAVMVITTLFSGFSYFKSYLPYFDTNK